MYNYVEDMNETSDLYQGGPQRPMQLPFLHNSLHADDSFKVLGLCSVTPSIDFFAKRGSDMNERAMALCGECSVSLECRTFALVTEQEYGVWGGVQERERCVEIRNNRLALTA